MEKTNGPTSLPETETTEMSPTGSVNSSIVSKDKGDAVGIDVLMDGCNDSEIPCRTDDKLAHQSSFTVLESLQGCNNEVVMTKKETVSISNSVSSSQVPSTEKIETETTEMSPTGSVNSLLVSKDKGDAGGIGVPMDGCDDSEIPCRTDDKLVHQSSFTVLESSQGCNNEVDMTKKETVYISNSVSSSQVPSTEKTKTYVCSCGVSFSKTTDLAAHKRWSCKQAEKKCQCDVCKDWFAHEHGLRRHMKHAHGGVFPCDACGLRFHNKMKLTRHWMESHYDDNKEPEKKLKCYICSKDNFNGKYELECHLLAHKYAKEKNVDVSASNSNREEFGSQSGSSSSLHSSDSMTHPFGHFGMRHGPPFGRFPFFAGHFSPYRQPYSNSSMFIPSHIPSPLPPHHATCPSPHPPPPPPPVPSPHHEFCPPPLSETPHHNHPFPSPLYSPQHEYFIPPPHSSSQQTPPVIPFQAPYPGMRRFFKHQNKLKWKHYFKAMMSHPFSPFSFSRRGPGSCGPNPSMLSPEEGMVTCEFCNETVSLKYIAWHRKRGCPVLCVHKCNTCERVFASSHLLLRHMSKQGHTHSSSVDGKMPLIQEERDSSTISSLQEKLNTVLNFQKGDISGTESPVSVIKESDRLNMDDSEVAMKDHMLCKLRTSAPAHLPDEADNVDEPVLTIHEDSSNNFTCLVCRNILETKINMQQHLQDHLTHLESVKKVQEWKQKSAKFFLDDSEGSCDTSIATSEELSFSTCTSLEFDGNSNVSSQASSGSTLARDKARWLKPHGKHKHTRLKRQTFPCVVCNETFAFRKDLHYHMKEKHKNNTLECPICHKTFAVENRVKFYERHMKSHYGVAVYKHKCEVCDKTFLENHKLQAHMSTHKAELLHTCDTCGKGYGNKSSLLRHQRKHTGNKPHQCQVCDESFWEKRELVRHSTSHTGTAPFVCSHCGQGFTLKTSLMKHVKRKHP